MRLDDVDNGGTGFWRDVEADDEVLVKFRQVSFTFPDMNVCADVDKRLRRVADGFAILLELKDAVVDIVGVVQWKVAVDRFGAPNLGRNINNEVASQQRVVTVIMLGKRISTMRKGQDVGLQLNWSRDKWRREIVVEVVGWGTGERQSSRERELVDRISCRRMHSSLEKSKRHVITSSS